MKQSTLEGLRRYADHGIPPGDFLRAVLENNLMEAVGRADYENRLYLYEICDYIYNEMPFNCHGSPENVRAWLDAFTKKRDAGHAEYTQEYPNDKAAT